jgi:pentatricopeptide repeat protein
MTTDDEVRVAGETLREPQQDTAPEPLTAPAESEDHYAQALRRFRGDVRMMEQVLATMIERGAPRDEVHLGLMLDEYLSTRELRKARAIIGQLEEAGLTIDTRQHYDVAIATATAGSVGEALAMLDRLAAEQRDPSATQAPVVLTLLVDAGRLQVAWSLFRRMVSRGQVAARETHLTLLADCLARRAAKDSLSVIRTMVSAGQAVPARRASEIVRMLARIGQVDRALELLGVLEGPEAAVQGSIDVDGYGAVLDALAAQGRVDDAFAVTARMAQRGLKPSSHHRNALLAARISAADLDTAWTEAEGMWEDGVLVSGTNLEALLDLALEAGNSARAVGILDWLLMVGAPVAALRSGSVVRAELASGGIDRALPLVRDVLDRGLVFDRAAARDLVERLVRARRLDEASTWLERFRSAGTLTQGRSYSSLLHALVAAKRFDDVVALVGTIVEHGVRPVEADVARLVAGRIKAGDLARAEAIARPCSGAGVHVDDDTLRELLWAHARKGDVAAVEGVLTLVVAAGITPDERHAKARAWASGETPRRLEDTVDGDTTASDEAAVRASDEVLPAPDLPPTPVAPSADVTGPDPASEPLSG